MFQTDKLVAESGEKISEASKDKISEAISTAKDALTRENNSEEIGSEFQKLNSVAQEVSQEMYEAARQSADAQPPEPQSSEPDDDVVDAEFEEVQGI